LTEYEAEAMLRWANPKFKAASKEAIVKQHSFCIGELVDIKQGPSQHCTTHTGVLAAKVYTGHKDQFTQEVEVSQTLNHTNLVKFIKTFSIHNDGPDRHYPRCVADMLECNFDPPGVLALIARNCFDALCHVHSKGLDFADFKPGNIMLSGSEPIAVLVDYGATVPLRSLIVECTEACCLDANTGRATEELDWVCLGTTLAAIAGFDVFDFNAARDLVYEINYSDRGEHVKQLLVSCMENPSLSKIKLALINYETCAMQLQ
jgi:serine/threonine protein kinase